MRAELDRAEPATVPEAPATPVTGPLDRLTTVAAATARFAAYFGGIGIACLVLVTVTDVTRRGAGLGAVNGLLDLTEVALVFVVYFGFAQAEADKTHIRTNVLTERLPGRARRALAAAVWVLILAFLLWTVLLTGQAALESFYSGESRVSQSGVPVWPARAMVCLGLLGLATQSFANVVAAICGPGKEPTGDR